MIQEKLEVAYVNIEKAHRVGNTSNASSRTAVATFSSFKGNQNIYINKDFSKETRDIKEREMEVCKIVKKSR